MRKIITGILFLAIYHTSLAQGLYIVSRATVSFDSDAPLELIKAASDQLTGVIDVTNRSFAFRIPMNSFKGFNSSLQQLHFNEHYIESAKYPLATFEGKIIEEINFDIPGKHNVRGKGSLIFHGVTQERIIKCDLVLTPGKIMVSNNFTILLVDHNIEIPTVVNQKIAEEIIVRTKIELVSKEP